MAQKTKEVGRAYAAQVQLVSGGNIHDTTTIATSWESALDRFLTLWNKSKVQDFHSIKISTTVHNKEQVVYSYVANKNNVVSIKPDPSMLKHFRVLMWKKGGPNVPEIVEVGQEKSCFTAAITAAKQAGFFSVYDLQHVMCYELEGPKGKPAGKTQEWGKSALPATRAVLRKPIGTAMVTVPTAKQLDKLSETSFPAKSYVIFTS